MPTVTDALSYVEAGFAIFPVWGIQNSVCECRGRVRGTVCTPGKHPMGHLAPHGAGSASSDADVVRSWWKQSPTANIGIALGRKNNNLLCLDIDHTATAQSLLKKLLPTSDDVASSAILGYIVVATGRGCHVYFRFSGTERFATRKLSAKGIGALGEVRGEGSYTVLPPSIHISGKHYGWTHGSLLTTPVLESDDPTATVNELFGTAAVEIPDASAPVDIGATPSFRAIEIPFSISGCYDLIQRLDPTFPPGNHSNDLHVLGRKVADAARMKHYPLTVIELAGILKHADTLRPYRKFVARYDADREYWRSAYKIIVVEPTLPKKAK